MAFHQSPLRKNLSLCTVDGVLATPYVLMIVPGNIFLANFLAGPVGLRDALFGLIVSLPAWANALQALVVPALGRRWSIRTLTLYPGLASAFIWCGFAATIPWLPYESAQRISQVVFFVLLGMSIAQAVNGVAWTAWIQGWIPPRARARYFGKRNQILGLITVAFTGAGGMVMDATENSLLGYQVLFVVAGIGRLISMAVQFRIADDAPRPPTPTPHPPREVAPPTHLRLRDDRDFVAFVAFAGILTFGLNIAGPFAPAYMAQYLDFPVGKQAVLVVLANLMGALAVPRWARAIDRYGHRYILALTATLWMLMDYNWVWISDRSSDLLFLMWLWGGTMSVGVVLGMFNLLLRLTPPTLRTSAVSVHLAITSVLGALAPMLAGWMLAALQSAGWTEQSVYRLILFIKPTIVIASLFILYKVREPAPTQIPGLFGAFRSVRQAFTQSGQVFLANITFIRPVAFQRWRRLRLIRQKRLRAHARSERKKM